MKNIIISILTTKIIMGASFWNFSDNGDVIMCAIAMFLMLWILIESVDEWVMKILRERRRKKRQVEKFKLEVINLMEKEVI